MAITSGERHDLHTRLSEILGENQANTLMEYLPPVGWADVATKRDLDTFGMQLRQEMVILGADLRSEIATLGSELRDEIIILTGRIDRESINRRADTEALTAKIDQESTNRRADMEALMVKVVREQRVFVAAIFLAMSALVALSNVFG